jgi:hypothetical protein
MANGEDSGTWGTITNNNWNLMETAVAGIVTITMANTNYTLTVNNGIPDQARNMVIVANGTTGGTGKQIIAPLVPKFYVVSNQTTDGYSFTIGASTGTQVTIPNGITAQVYCDGSTGFYSAQSGSAGNFLVNGNLSVTGNQVDVGNLTVGGTLTLSSALINPIIQGIRETATISSTPASGSINYYTLSQSVLYYVSNAAGNWQLNFTGNGSTTLNSLLAVGQSTSLTFICAQGTTAYYNNAVYIDGTLQSPYWQGGTAPVAGYPSGLDVYTYAIIKTSATPTYTVLASQTQF